jgi:GDP-L-fucose synthase
VVCDSEDCGCQDVSSLPTGIWLQRDFVDATNLYGPGDNFDLQNSHVLPALIRRFHEAKARGDAMLTIWGTGTPRREFLHVDDLADAVVYLLQTYDGEPIVNIGWGEDVTIKELAEMVATVSGFKGRLEFDTSKPDGTPRKLLDTSRLSSLGWKPKITLRSGIEHTYAWFKEHVAEARLSA